MLEQFTAQSEKQLAALKAMLAYTKAAGMTHAQLTDKLSMLAVTVTQLWLLAHQDMTMVMQHNLLW